MANHIVQQVNYAKEQIQNFDKELNKEKEDWKNKLTGGIDSTQLFMSLFILGCFYTCYTIINYSLGNTRDQYSITSSCFCRKRDQALYNVAFLIFCGIWVFVHTYIFLQRQSESSQHRCFRDCCDICELFRKCICECPCLLSNSPGYEDSRPESPPSDQNGSQDNSLNSVTEEKKNREHLNFKHYERILWYRYYKLYVVGYAKNIEPQEKLELQPQQQQQQASAQESPDEKPPKQPETEPETEPETYELGCCGKCPCCTKISKCHLAIRKFVRFILECLKYIAQGATVPILMLQVFDTYALLCFIPDLYCATASEYKIHLSQVAITISFYFCIALAQLTSVLLEWDERIHQQEENTVKNNGNNP